MRTKKEMRHYLRQWKDRSPLAGLVLKKGQWFIGRAKSNDYEVALEWRMRRKPKAQECHFNSQQFCTDCRNVRYFEGYLLIGGPPIEHAWAVMEDGKVVDFTVESLERKAKRDKSIFIDTMPPYIVGFWSPGHLSFNK
jgi:hypothetical protein